MVTLSKPLFDKLLEDQSASEFKVFTKLLQLAQESQARTCAISVENLSRTCALSLWTVNKVLKNLKAKNYIEDQGQPDHNSPKQYKLLVYCQRAS